MGYKEVNNDYLKTQVMSASPIKLIVMLYEGAIKNMKIAELAIEKQDIVQAHQQLRRAQDIIKELKNSVNAEVESDVPEDLVKLYDYCYNQLVVANLTKDKYPIDNVIQIMSELLDSWRKLAQNN
jgi:flagellar protein FliS